MGLSFPCLCQAVWAPGSFLHWLPSAGERLEVRAVCRRVEGGAHGTRGHQGGKLCRLWGFSSSNEKLCTQHPVHRLSCARSIPSSPHPVVPSQPSNPSSPPPHASPTALTQPRQDQAFGPHDPGRAGAMPLLFPVESPAPGRGDCAIEGAQCVLSARTLFPKQVRGSPPILFYLCTNVTLST